MKPWYPIADILQEVAERISDDTSSTTIRCAINDRADFLRKDGYNVSDTYNQNKAIKRVRAMVAKRW